MGGPVVGVFPSRTSNEITASHGRPLAIDEPDLVQIHR
jgi:hypothetical protein